MTGLQSKLLLKSSPSRAKTSKIKFKEGAYEPVDVVSRPSSASDRSSTTNWKLIKHDETDTLDPNKCYHKDCSFAYNLTVSTEAEPCFLYFKSHLFLLIFDEWIATVMYASTKKKTFL